MARYTVSIWKKQNNANPQHWSNVYHLDALNLADAHAFATSSLLTFEESIHSTEVNFVRVITSSSIPDDNQFISAPVDELGGFIYGGDLLPIFLAVRVDWVPEFGYMGRKYYHACLGEGNQSNGVWQAPYTTDVGTAANQMFGDAGLAGVSLINPQGTNQYNAIALQTPVAQHQFKRKWARRVPV